MEIANEDPLIYEDDDGDFRLYYKEAGKDEILLLCDEDIEKLLSYHEDNPTIVVVSYEAWYET